MRSEHRVFYKDAKDMKEVLPETIDLVITSPPYPMIEMWDEVFSGLNSKIGNAIDDNDGPEAFELMHRELDFVWDEVNRVLKKGGIACINIGDATRTLKGHFALYTNHSRIHAYMQRIGFSALPAILWRKQTNAPNKFMGSGMMPPGAYVTLEHEYILILRKGNKKEFKTIKEKKNRRESCFFWEERNAWFSDIWTDLKGASQNLFEDKARNRSAAYPFELPYRIITMLSVKDDTILDPFFGIGTTMYAAMAAGRNSIGYEIDENMKEVIGSKTPGVVEFSNNRIRKRLEDHIAFVENRFEQTGKFKYLNKYYQFPVMTNQETDLIINKLQSVKDLDDNSFEIVYADEPQEEFVGILNDYALSKRELSEHKKARKTKKMVRSKQQQLFGDSLD